VNSLLDAFTSALRANACVVQAPLPPADAATTIAARAIAHADGGAIAVAGGDALVNALGVVDALRDHGAAVLLPDDDWNGRLASATVGVTGSVLAVADPGAFAIAAGPGSPRGTSLLPRTHVCAVACSSIVATLAEAFAVLARAPLPSALTWIGGPSRTGDLEMVLTLGVHGPDHVEVVLVADAGGAGDPPA
jgi:L-lactate dehydrogenase complex protein LldG